MSNLQYKVFTDEIMENFFNKTLYKNFILFVSGNEEISNHYFTDLKKFFLGKDLNEQNKITFYRFLQHSIIYIFEEFRSIHLKKKARHSSYLHKSKKEQMEWVVKKAKDFKEFLSLLDLDMFTSFKEYYNTTEFIHFLDYMIENPGVFVSLKRKPVTKSILKENLMELHPAPLKKDIDAFLSITLENTIDKNKDFNNVAFRAMNAYDNLFTTPFYYPISK